MTDTEQMIAQLVQLTELRKAFHHLPVATIHEPKLLPVGTVAQGRLKVQTQRGQRWKSGRRGMVRSAEAAVPGGRTGFPESGSSGG